MPYKLENVLERTNMKEKTLKLYICRAEFAHIRIYGDEVFKITEEDIEKLKSLRRNKNCSKGC